MSSVELEKSGAKVEKPTQVAGATPGNLKVEPVDKSPGFSAAVFEEQVPVWKRIWRHSLTQMMLLSVQAFCGPAMDDAIAGLLPNLLCILR